MARGKAKDKYIVTSQHVEDLASGRTVSPGENINAGDLDLGEDESRDQRLIDEGALTRMEEPATQTAPAKATGGGDDNGGDS